MMFILFDYIFGGIRLLLAKIYYGKKLKINVFSSPILGKILIRGNGAIRIGKKCRARDVTINVNGGHLFIGKDVFLNSGCSLNCQESIIINDGAIFGENVLVYDHDHKVHNGKVERREFISKPVEIGKGSWIGANTLILKGVRIGDNSIVAAGSIIVKDVPDGKIMIQKRANEYKDI
jgi:acetyltransferase-like isoleucine patch superfamily enzyme